AVAADPTRSGAFAYREDLNAAYATFQRKLGELTVLAGLRLEDARTVLTGGGTRHQSDRRQPFPSLHLSYPLGEGRTVSASYSRRIDRPAPGQLNPLIVFGDRQILFGGNPALRPQETDSFEVAYDARKGASSVAATLYYRALHDAFAQVARDQGGGAILFTQDNLGEARKIGLSLAGNRQLTATISLNLSGDAFWTQVPTSALGLGETRSGTAVSGRGALSWSPTADDLLQLNGRLTGRTIGPQGTLGPTGILDLGYRRRLSPSLFAIVTVQNLLDSNRQQIRFRTPTVNGRRTLDGTGRTALVTLTYNFGSDAKKRRDPAIDYGAGPPVP
ncbi:MAG: TonB-dependent receptor family protein, partial [Proteobacteria bacterium]|nr:TonB-dependent receptor family protein [Pseudomonadota bacterium]